MHCLSALRTVTILVFRLRRKTDTKQKQIASGRRRCAGASGLFIRFRKLQKHPHHFFIFNSERIAVRAPRITTSVKQERLKRTVLPKRVKVPQLPKKLLSKRNRGETGFSPTSPADLFLRNKKKKLSAKADSLQTQVFRQRRKTIEKQKQIASGRKIKSGANRGSRAANHDH